MLSSVLVTSLVLKKNRDTGSLVIKIDPLSKFYQKEVQNELKELFFSHYPGP